MPRTQPNIIITGTPGVGKTSHCEALAQNAKLQHLQINRLVKERKCHDGWDEEHQSYIVDEDGVGRNYRSHLPLEFANRAFGLILCYVCSCLTPLKKTTK